MIDVIKVTYGNMDPNVPVRPPSLDQTDSNAWISG